MGLWATGLLLPQAGPKSQCRGPETTCRGLAWPGAGCVQGLEVSMNAQLRSGNLACYLSTGLQRHCPVAEIRSTQPTPGHVEVLCRVWRPA